MRIVREAAHDERPHQLRPPMDTAGGSLFFEYGVLHLPHLEREPAGKFLGSLRAVVGSARIISARQKSILARGLTRNPESDLWRSVNSIRRRSNGNRWRLRISALHRLSAVAHDLYVLWHRRKDISVFIDRSNFGQHGALAVGMAHFHLSVAMDRFRTVCFWQLPGPPGAQIVEPERDCRGSYYPCDGLAVR